MRARRGRLVLGLAVLTVALSPILARAALVNAAAAELASTGFIAVASGSAPDGALARADGYLRLAQRLTSSDATVSGLRGQIALQRGDTEAAIAYLRAAQAGDPTNRAAGWWLGELYLSQGKEEDALAAWRTASLGPAVFNTAYRYSHARDMREALRWFTYAAAVQPDHEDSYSYQAATYQELGRPFDALQVYLQSMTRFPHAAWAYAGAAKLLTEAAGEPELARDVMERCLAHADRPQRCPR
jgi:tetratricopeptide (TPR) repeat protein